MDKSLEAYIKELKETVNVLAHCDAKTNAQIVNYLVGEVESKTAGLQFKLRQMREDR